MSVTFTKLFTSITESTVWCEPDRTRLAWITMLAMADSQGRVWGSIPGLANRARIPVDDCRIAIAAFMAPDTDSRTKAHEGRRIEEIDGGWRLLNHAKYRAIRDEESIKESKRKYINARRASERQSTGVDIVSTNVDRGRAIAEADTEAKKDTPPSPAVIPPLKGRASKRCPGSFMVSTELQAWARSSAPLVDIRAETATFRDYEFGKACTDWPARWRVWMTKEQKRLAENAKRSSSIGAVQSMQVEKHQHQKQWTEGIFGTKQLAPATQPMELSHGLVREIDA